MDYPVKTPQQLAQVLKGIRKDRRLTQATIASRMGSVQSKISALELQPGRTSVERLLRVLSILGVDLILRDRSTPTRNRTPSKSPSEW
jgi:HTH-type transcriptional regulator / antitoxin HipB